MRAIMVSVNYSDLLAVTLPYNRHHFEEVWVVTSKQDYPTVLPIAKANLAMCIATDLFYERGATFNKFAALEHGLDVMGRKGWLALVDSDVLWPKDIRSRETDCGEGFGVLLNIDWPQANCPDGRNSITYGPGTLITPLRRMYTHLQRATDGGLYVPHEDHWLRYPVHRNVAEWAGYSQIFHADDPHLGPTPWHDTTFTHAGAADSLFQDKWPRECKVRPPWECLHLGPSGANWMGRATPFADGTVPPDAREKAARVAAIWEGRRGKSGDERFRGERLA